MLQVLFVLLVLFPKPGFAELTKLVVEKREVFAEGHEFGVTGAYEKIAARAYGELDPKAKHNKPIVNINKAPANDHGRIEYSMDVFIFKPIDMKRGNRTIFYDVVNRGNQALRVNFGAERSNSPTTLAHAGDGFTMREGYALVWSGWQGDVLPGAGRLTANFVAAKNSDGSAIKRVITTEFVFQKPAFSVPLSFDRESLDVKPYPPVEESMTKARLYRRAATHAEREFIPRDQWSFDRCRDGKAKSPSSTEVCLPAGFSPNWIYELTYEARDPIVMGLGFAATRDLVSFLRYNATDNNPLRRHRYETAPLGHRFRLVPGRAFLKGSHLSRLQSGRSRQGRFRRRDSTHLGVAAHIHELRVRHARPLFNRFGKPLHSRRRVSFYL